MNTPRAPFARKTYPSWARKSAPLAVMALLSAATLAGCSTGTAQSGSETQSSSEHPAAEGSATEQATAVARLAMTYDGGIMIYDAETLELVDQIELAGFNRLNPAGNGQDLMVSTTGKFQVLDAGTWGQAHGDHFHYFTNTPSLTDVSYKAETPGHVVVHDGKTALFDDGTGLVQIVASDEIGEADAEVTEYQAKDPHHGVAVPLADGTLLVTEGNEDARSTLLAVKDGKTVAQNDDCDNIHGEAVAAHEVAAFGCADGALIYHDGNIEKIQSPDTNGRLGTLVGDENSHYILSNYTPDYTGEVDENKLTTVAIIDTENEKITSVDIGTGYSFRSLARGDNGEALVLGADGKLHVIDPETAKETASYPVLDAWEVPEDWQLSRPAVFSHDGTAYVTDPASKTIYAVDIETGEVWKQATLAETPNELTGVTGKGEAASSTEEGHDHDHEGEDHDHAESEHSH